MDSHRSSFLSQVPDGRKGHHEPESEPSPEAELCQTLELELSSLQNWRKEIADISGIGLRVLCYGSRGIQAERCWHLCWNNPLLWGLPYTAGHLVSLIYNYEMPVGIILSYDTFPHISKGALRWARTFCPSKRCKDIPWCLSDRRGRSPLTVGQACVTTATTTPTFPPRGYSTGVRS